MIIYPSKPINRKAKVVVRSFLHREVKGIFNSIPYREIVADGDWTPFFGTSVEERQKFGPWDSNDCWEFSPTKQLEIQFNALCKRGEFSAEAIQFFQSNGIMDVNGFFNISDQFYDILSKNYGNGGTAEEYFQLVQDYGIIPYSLLHCTEEIANRYGTQQAFDAYYYGSQNITQQMLSIGEQSLKYFNLQYQRIGRMFKTPDKTLISGAIKQSPLAYGVPVRVSNWNQVNVPADTDLVLNHEVTGYKLNQTTQGYPIIDNYSPFLKVLSNGYALNSVSQGIITAITSAPLAPKIPSTWEKCWSAVMDFFRSIGEVIREGGL